MDQIPNTDTLILDTLVKDKEHESSERLFWPLKAERVLVNYRLALNRESVQGLVTHATLFGNIAKCMNNDGFVLTPTQVRPLSYYKTW